jgi:hypothetical protein
MVGLFFAIKVYWRRIKSFSMGLFSKGRKMDGSESEREDRDA